MRESTETLIAEYENLIALMKQEDGATKFECSAKKCSEWVPCICPTEPVWDSAHANFRVKPKPVEGWAWKYPSGILGSPAFIYNQKQTSSVNPVGCVMVLMREVTK